VIESTGEVEFGARRDGSRRNGKHVILMNAEVDSSVGPISQDACGPGRRGLHLHRRR
jgi:predicted homoserine dehydrogenase-like protein